MNRDYRKEAFFMLLLIVIAFATFSCAGQTPKVKKTIKIGVNIDLTGATAARDSSLLLDAAKDHIRYINEVEGGLKGVRLELIWADSGYSLPRALSNYQRFKEAEAPIILVQVSHEAFALKPLAERDRIPVFSHAVDSNGYYPPGWAYTSGGGSTPEYFAVFLKWIKENWKESRPPRIAIVGWDNTLGRAPQSVKRYVEETRVEIVAEEFLPVFTVDFTGYLLRIQKAAPDYIFVGMAAGGIGPFLKDSERLGLRGKIPIISNGVVPLFSFYGTAGEYLEGLMSFHGKLPPFDPRIEGMQRVKDSYQKIHGKPFYDDQRDAYAYMWGWIEILSITEILRQTADSVGIDRVNGETVKALLDKGAKIDTGGITRILSYGGEKRRGNDFARMMQVKGGKIVPISDWIEVPVVRE